MYHLACTAIRSLAVLVCLDGEGAETGDERAVRGELLGLEIRLLLEHQERRGELHGGGGAEDSFVRGGFSRGEDLGSSHTR